MERARRLKRRVRLVGRRLVHARCNGFAAQRTGCDKQYLSHYNEDGSIRSFRHKGLRRLFEKGESRGVRPDHVEKLENILAVLNRAGTADDVNLPGFRLDPLEGDLRGFWSVTVRANWRITFRLDRGDAHDVDLVDSHQENAAMRSMKNPPHPGRIIRQECIEPLGLTVTEAAQQLRVTRQALSNVLNAKAGISPAMAIRLAKAFGSSPEVWLGLQMQYDLAREEKTTGRVAIRRITRRRPDPEEAHP